MVASRSCRRQRISCLDHCQNWVKYNYKPLPEKLEDDLKKSKKTVNYFDLNMNILMLVVLFLLLSFIVYMIFNLKK